MYQNIENKKIDLNKKDHLKKVYFSNSYNIFNIFILINN
jgi:hypothetical protein